MQDLTQILKCVSPESVAEVRKLVPSAFVGLNVAQYRGFRAAYTRDGNGHRPAIAIISFANGVGKTVMLVLDMIGWCLGSKFIAAATYPKEVIEFYDRLNERRDAGKLVMRLVCTADDMKAGGSVLEAIKEFFPMAKVGAMDTGKCFREIVVPHPEIARVVNTISVKTFDQDEAKHAGTTTDRIWINEPIPENLVGETIGRIRSKAGKPEGAIMMCATLLDGAEWVDGLEDDADLRTVNCRGHIYENCRDKEVSREMSLEVFQTTGNKLEQRADGTYITNGVLQKASIDVMIKLWARTCPHELEARKSGAPMSAGGRLHKQFNIHVHTRPDEMYHEIPDGWPITQIIDPHNGKEDYSLWMLTTPSNKAVAVYEWPERSIYGPYEDMRGKRYNIQQTVDIWRKLEAELGFAGHVFRRVGDPNKFKEPQAGSGQSLLYDYAAAGWRDIEINVSDDIDLGTRRINEFLYYDDVRIETTPEDPDCQPRLIILNNCMNLITSLSRIGTKKKNNRGVSQIPGVMSYSVLDQKHKDPWDALRYFLMSFQDFETCRIDDSKLSDYQKIQIGRLPPSRRGEYEGIPISAPRGYRFSTGLKRGFNAR
jgi:hypothetical protein